MVSIPAPPYLKIWGQKIRAHRNFSPTPLSQI